MQEAGEYERIIWIHKSIIKGSLSKELYEHKFGKAERTFYRDIDKLKYNFNAPIEKRNGRYIYTDITYELPQMLISQKELASLFTALGIVEKYKDTPIYSTTKKIIQKLSDESTLNELYGYNIGNLRKKEIVLDWNIFNKIAKSIINKESIVIDYNSLNSKERSERKVDPYHLYTYEEEIYLAAYCHKNKAIRDFNLNRIYSIKSTWEKFSGGFDKNKYFANKNWGIIKNKDIERVRLKIRSSEVEWVIEDFPSRFKKISNGDEWSEYEVETSISDEFVNWILAFSEDLIIMKPESLKSRFLHKIKKITENYRK